MFSKAYLKKLAWEKVAILGGALLLIASSLWLGSSSLGKGDLNLLQNLNLNNGALSVTPIISSITVTPNTAVRNSHTRMYVSYTVRRDLTEFGIFVKDLSDRVVRTLDLQSPRAIGTYSNATYWDGTGDNATYNGDAPSGRYKIVFTGRYAGGYQTLTHYVEITDGASNGNQNVGSVIRDAYLVPNDAGIDATIREPARVYYFLNRPAYVTEEVFFENGNRYFVGKENQYVSNVDQQQFFEWHGQFSNVDNPVDSGRYYFKITARNLNAVDESRTFYINVAGRTTDSSNNGNANFNFSNVTSDPVDFNSSYSPTIRFSFNLNQAPQSLLAQIFQGNGTRLVAGLQPTGGYNYSTGQYTYNVTWDGRDQVLNSAAFPGQYSLRLQATSASYGTITASRSFNVNQGGTNYNNGYYNPYVTDPYGNNGYSSARCQSFSDISASDPICPAVQFAFAKGFMRGYPDGTMGLNKVIRRAEYLAVIQKAFNYTLYGYSPFNDGAMGFTDLHGKETEWYMPYIRTFVQLGIMRGYPDRTMKPEKTMTTAELYVSLLKAALNSPGTVARFTLPNAVYYSPFSDTPVSASTSWYINQAEFARRYSLVTGTQFNPGKGITRGQVIKLIYDMKQKGLLAI